MRAPNRPIPLLGLAGPVLIVAAWAAVSALQLFPSSLFPDPGAVGRGLVTEFMSGRLVQDVLASLFRVGAGFLLATAIGIPAGLLLGHSAMARAALLPLVNFFRNLSPLAWIPFAILWLGIGDPPAIFLIFMAAVFPVVLSTAAAVANIPSVYFRVAGDLGIKGPRLLSEVTLPAIAPQVITTLRVTAGLSWLVVVAAEMIAGRDGLGFAVWDARNGLRIDLLAAVMVVIGLIGVGLDRLLVQMTRIPSVRWGYER
ncbi:ABC transporter permease [Luteitalea pratensis]|uniref:ABC transporter permease n=1 Tax=Luteitalea pratensis TaxID=1855912 RepID=UPI0012FF8641|nr:ABC transporter permease [Luteitalea pratensis]